MVRVGTKKKCSKTTSLMSYVRINIIEGEHQKTEKKHVLYIYIIVKTVVKVTEGVEGWTMAT